MADFRNTARQRGRSAQVAKRWNAWRSVVRSVSNVLQWVAGAGTPRIERSRVYTDGTASYSVNTGQDIGVGALDSGKYYFEFTLEHGPAVTTAAVMGVGFKNNTQLSVASHEKFIGIFFHNSGQWRVNTNLTGYTVQLPIADGDALNRTPKANMRLRVAMDVTNHKFYVAVDDIWLRIVGPTGGDPKDDNGIAMTNFTGVTVRPYVFVAGDTAAGFSGFASTPPKERIPAGYTVLS